MGDFNQGPKGKTAVLVNSPGKMAMFQALEVVC
jgi:hypothetical protein